MNNKNINNKNNIINNNYKNTNYNQYKNTNNNQYKNTNSVKASHKNVKKNVFPGIKLIKTINLNIFIQIIVFLLLISFDQITKALAYFILKDADDVNVISEAVTFHYLENTGAAFGILKDQSWFFYVLTAIVLIAIFIIWFSIYSNIKKYIYRFFETENFKYRTYKNSIFLNYILAVLAAGAIGNLIDRVFYKHVIDFIYFKFIDFPVFNLADIYVTLSAVMLFVFFIFIYKTDDHFSIFRKMSINK